MSYVLHRETDPTGLSLTITGDEFPPNPRTAWDHVGTMVCWHGRYLLGDDHDFADPSAYRRAVGDDILELPLYLLDHSGLSMRTTPFECPWDSGQIGWIYVQRQEVLVGFDRRRMSQGLRQAALNLLRSEVAVYDQWLRHDVWTVTVRDPGGVHLDSCSGFYGQASALVEGRSMLAQNTAAWREQRDAAMAAAIAESRPDLAPAWEAQA